MKNIGQKIKQEVYMQILDGMIGSQWGDKQVWKKKLQDLKAGHYDELIVTILPGCYTPNLSTYGLQPPYPPQRPLTRSVKQIYNILYSIYYDKLKFMYSSIDFTKEALKNVEQEGIIFLDEIDKLAMPQRAGISGKGVSTQGVQRDLLPLIEGSIINTKYGDVKTDHILFIASGSFSMSKVQDLMPQLLGRLPIRVKLNPISLTELQRILKQPQFNLLMQQINLLKTQEVNLIFNPDAIQQLAQQAYMINQRTQNIGARRLHSVVQKVIQQISFDASEMKGKEFVITKEYVNQKLQDMSKNIDLTKYLI